MWRQWAIIAAVLAGVLAVGVATAPVSADEAVNVRIHSDQRRQTMLGWEVAAKFWEEDKPNDRFDGSWLEHREEILSVLANHVGINRLRIEVRSGAENPQDHWTRFTTNEIGYRAFREVRYQAINDNADPNVINMAGFQFSHLNYQMDNVVLPMQALLAARGERLYVNLCFVDFGDQQNGDISFARAPEEYAEFMSAVFQHLRDVYNFSPDALEIMLEPDNRTQWNAQAVGRAAVAASRRLRADGFTPAIIAPSTTAATRTVEYLNTMRSVPGISGVISMVSYHTYDNPGDDVRASIQQAARRIGAQTGMLEHLPAGASELQRDLVSGGVSACQQYGIAHRDSLGGYDDGGYLLFFDAARPREAQLRYGSRTSGLAQFFTHVRFGAVRVEANSDQTFMRPAAFIDAQGGVTTMLVADRAATIQLSGLPAGAYRVEFAPPPGPRSALAPVQVDADGTATVTAPGEGVMAVFPAR